MEDESLSTGEPKLMQYRATGPVEEAGWAITPCPECGASAMSKQEPLPSGMWLIFGYCEACNTDWQRTFRPTVAGSFAAPSLPSTDPEAQSDQAPPCTPGSPPDPSDRP